MSHKRSMNVPQAAENAIKGTRAQLRAYKVGCRRALSAVIELLLCWLVSRTYRLYCSGSKVALGLSLRAQLLAPPLATDIYVMPIMTRRCVSIFTALLPAAR